MFHEITLVGYLGRDPELRYTQNGTPVASFSVATTRKWKNQDGSQGEETVWWRVSAWRRMAETCNQYLHKGSLVLIKGEMKPDKNGNPRVFTRSDGSAGASFELTARTVKFPSRSNGGNDGSDAPADEPMAPPAEEEIPF
jgi:single-strand DNA-binding protein